ncbi:MAG TPA: dehypoxanthine futalosine cyclase [Bacteroidales bacterium]|nr:dehypoxanthine futalosine cyclase [Bacteroidales bacterium]
MKCREDIIAKALRLDPLSVEEAVRLYRESPLTELMNLAKLLREKHVPGNNAGWIIDRNVNITNVCFSQCKFCNFCCTPGHPDSYITTIDEYRQKITELFEKGGRQLLLQGGMHPSLGLGFYNDLFTQLKSEFPELLLHALGPPEIVHLARMERKPYRYILDELVRSGLDSLPGAGAEILVDRVRDIVSPAKATANEWLEVMKEAHKMNLPTSATMMYGHIESIEERIIHLIKIRDLQAQKPEGSYGFITFIPWPFQDEGTLLARKYSVYNNTRISDHIRIIAISRIVLNNISNIQSSILTTGRDTALMTLNAGANDLGSVMIEENVVSAAGSSYMFSGEELQSIIREAGFNPVLRNQKYEPAKD